VSEMVDRIARAIHKAIYLNGGLEDDDGWDDCSPILKEHRRNSARAALEAMRPATADMIARGEACLASCARDNCEQTVDHVYTDMLLAALTQPKPVE
jgi:hypothetical protein